MGKSYTHEIKENKNLLGFLSGSKLGDGCFSKKTIRHNTRIIFKHSDSQYEYLLWKSEFLKNYKLVKDFVEIKKRNFTEGKLESWDGQHYFSTISHDYLNKYKNYSNIELINNLNSLGFCIWFLDDGNICGATGKLSCALFTREEMSHTIRRFEDVFGLECFEYNHPSKEIKKYIRFNKYSVLKIFQIMKENKLENLDVVKNKFGEFYDYKS